MQVVLALYLHVSFILDNIILNWSSGWLNFVPHFTGDAYNTEERAVVAGYDNGDIKMFDLKKMAVRWETNVKNGVCQSLCVT